MFLFGKLGPAIPSLCSIQSTFAEAPHNLGICGWGGGGGRWPRLFPSARSPVQLCPRETRDSATLRLAFPPAGFNFHLHKSLLLASLEAMSTAHL